MRCNACGNEIPNGSTMCPFCGSAIKNENDVEKTQATGVEVEKSIFKITYNKIQLKIKKIHQMKTILM